MINIAICDDENIIVSQIESIIFNICKRESILVDTDVFYSGQTLEKEISNGTKYDLIYLDIQMANGDGIVTAKNIRKMDENVLLIYVSGYDKYMMELFRLDVFAFIKKPIEDKYFEYIFWMPIEKSVIVRYIFRFIIKTKSIKFYVLTSYILKVVAEKSMFMSEMIVLKNSMENYQK